MTIQPSSPSAPTPFAQRADLRTPYGRDAVKDLVVEELNTLLNNSERLADGADPSVRLDAAEKFQARTNCIQLLQTAMDATSKKGEGISPLQLAKARLFFNNPGENCKDARKVDVVFTAAALTKVLAMPAWPLAPLNNFPNHVEREAARRSNTVDKARIPLTRLPRERSSRGLF